MGEPYGPFERAVHVLCREALGIERMSAAGKRVRLRFPDTELEWCEGDITIGDESP